MRRAALFALFAAACAPKPEALPTVTAAAETEPVGTSDDAADDPAVWLDHAAPEQSLILGTDKNAGLYLYDLKGAVVQFLPAGELNNVDLRQNVSLGGWSGDIAAATNRSDDTVTLFALENRQASVSGAFPSPLEEPYGLCMGRAGDETLVFVTYKTGDVVAFRLIAPGAGEEIARLKLASQLEGCVFDDDAGVLYIGEEDRGIWKADFAGDRLSNPRLVDEVGKASGLKDDVEGLALYRIDAVRGYLVASSQGNNSYAVYEREGDNRFVGRFRIGPGAAIDGAEETDGIEAVAVPLGPDFPMGALIAQDGFNDPKGSAQNFKIVDWREIEKALAR
ncbi:MAG: phytase [Pseudomonadota bacterium]|nr:phytase [Pseudomonadota bacterium]